MTPYLQPKPGRHAGSMLLELTIALAVLTVGVLGFAITFQKNFTASRDIANRDLVGAAFANAMEQLRDADFSTLYAVYNNTTLAPQAGSGSPGTSVTTIGSLLDASGNPARVLVTFDVDETSLSAEYGPIADLDGDGVLNTTNCSASYRLLPAHLSLTYQTSSGTEVRHLFVVLGSRS